MLVAFSNAYPSAYMWKSLTANPLSLLFFKKHGYLFAERSSVLCVVLLLFSREIDSRLRLAG
ncbi:MAG: hypothetical protein AAF385_09190, partial [Pseudomonadota bacterium]